MYFSLESRVPFLDFRLVEKTLASTSDQIIREGWTKRILRDAMKGVLPEKIRLRRDKIGFDTPQSLWFKTPAFQKLVADMLASKKLQGLHIIDYTKAESLYKAHLQGTIDAAKEIWKLIHLHRWFELFVN